MQLTWQAERLQRHCTDRGYTTEIITVFSSRLYGARSRKNLKALAATH